MGSTAATLLMLIALFRYWPAFQRPGHSDSLYDARGERVVTVEMIQPTRQARRAPPPQVPMPPVEVPDDVDLADVVIDIAPEINLLPGDGTGTGAGGEGFGDAGAPAFVASADEAPKPIRFVEPEYSREARRQRIRAQIVVEVRIDTEGRVLESRIVDRFILKDDDTLTPVTELGYGVEEAVLAAAERWRFVPARHNGRTVESLSVLEFAIGG